MFIPCQDEAKKKLGEFISILRGCKAIVEAVEGFQACRDKLTSPLLRRLVTIGELFPWEVVPALEHFEAAFDWAQAEKEGRIVPTGAVDDKLDAANEVRLYFLPSFPHNFRTLSGQV